MVRVRIKIFMGRGCLLRVVRRGGRVGGAERRGAMAKKWNILECRRGSMHMYILIQCRYKYYTLYSIQI